MPRNLALSLVLTALVSSIFTFTLTILFMGEPAQATQPGKKIIAKSISIVDKTGKTRIRLDYKDGKAGIHIYDKNESKRIEMWSSKKISALRMASSKKEPMFNINCHDDDGPEVLLKATSNGIAVLRISNTADTALFFGVQRFAPTFAMFSNGKYIYGYPDDDQGRLRMKEAE